MSNLTRQPDGTVDITLTIPWPDIQAAYSEALNESLAQTEIKGFRKGKAPRNLVEPTLDKNQLYSHALQHLIPQLYSAAVKHHSLKPILYPKFQIKSGKEGESWVILATTCEAPVVTLPKKLSHLDSLLKTLEITIPKLLTEEEVNHRLAALAENISQLGLTIDTYLQTKKLTLDTLKDKIKDEAQTDLKREFILQAVQTSLSLENRQKTLDHLTSLK